MAGLCEGGNEPMGSLKAICIQSENVFLFVTVAAPYMIKASKYLKLDFPNMIHVTCLAHACHHTAEVIRCQFPGVDELIGAAKKIFVKAPVHVKAFKKIYPELSLKGKTDLALICDETADSVGRCVFTVLIKTEDTIFEQKIFLLECPFLYLFNSKTCLQAILSVLHKFEIEYENVKYVLTYSATATGVAQSVKALACWSEVVLGHGFDPRLG
ncbi:hypothetical protein ANN_25973 [Periplaneta americana]|uniref:DUF659 domain-containing protein n=1 Tax=Periplaneta americana TaxID=6978 RepID=A0ABQ8S505_PERAM|nr:hypothetical protein ANN_25973 [Periplaneta americana]